MSKYGHTKQYADWLKEEFDADIIAAASFNPTKLLAYRLIIFASGVYGDKIQIMELIKKNAVSVTPGKIMVAAVSWYTNDSAEAKEKLIQENFPENFKKTVPLFVINSGIDKKQINFAEKAQITAAQLAINKHESRSSDDINALAIIKGYSDQTSKDNLKSLKAAVNDFLHPPKNKHIAEEPPKSKPTAEEPPKTAPKPKSSYGGVEVPEVPTLADVMNKKSAVAEEKPKAESAHGGI
ncbi:MAG: hypothetical protein LUI05_03095, partial [Oscillospiraceae bacterium]|nr:hypothetical protein [Oscillospiraceae bacterium]